MTLKNNSTLSKHVTFCSQVLQSQSVYKAELGVIQFLTDNLNVTQVGDYQVLVHYNMPLRGTSTVEIDILVINRFGLFLLEIKDWRGDIVAYDDYWVLDQKYKIANPFETVNVKAKALHSKIFRRIGDLSEFVKVSVVGIVIIARETVNLKILSDNENNDIVGLEPRLVELLSAKNLKGHGSDSKILSNDEIQKIKDALLVELPESKGVFIGNYQIVRKLSSTELFDSYEAVHELTHQRVRIKRYELSTMDQAGKYVEQIKRNGMAVSRLGVHPHILATYHLFPDPDHSDVFYEVTEFIEGDRLDTIMTRIHSSLPFEMQLDYLEPLCAALAHAHKNKVFHRNLSPESVIVTREGTIKLADFDYAKVVGPGTITNPGQTHFGNPFTAPEVILNPSAASPASDIYSLGIIWYYLANLPENDPQITPEKIDLLNIPGAARELIKKMSTLAIGNRPQSAQHVLKQLKQLREESKC